MPRPRNTDMPWKPVGLWIDLIVAATVLVTGLHEMLRTLWQGLRATLHRPHDPD